MVPRSGHATAVARLGAVLGIAACAGREPSSTSVLEHERVETNPRCASCHAEIAAEWAISQHRSSHDAVFLKALSRERGREFCVGCHAPEAKNEREAEGARGELGVGCVTSARAHRLISLIRRRVTRCSRPSAIIREVKLP